jgi:trk system potassium uptake protein TrkA
MYVVIAGVGTVGEGLAAKLVGNRHDVVVIDTNGERCDDLAARYGVVAVRGNATAMDVLQDADLKRADVAVALMRSDADNLAFTLLARHFEVPRIIVRMRDSRYKTAYEKAGATNTVNPADIFIENMLLDIEQPDFVRVATLGGGKASVVILKIPEGSKAAGKSIAEITREEEFPRDCVVAGIYRSNTNEFIIPRGDRKLEVGDSTFLVADARDIRKAASYFGVKAYSRKL